MARVSVLVLVPVLLAGTSQARALYACAAMDRVLTHCCCSAAEPSRPAPTSLSRAACCEALETGGALPSVGVPPELASHEPLELARFTALGPLQPPALAAVHTAAPAAPLRRSSIRTRAGPSLVLLHRRLLI